jgi:hypothetical protein
MELFQRGDNKKLNKNWKTGGYSNNVYHMETGDLNPSTTGLLPTL